jgi:DNA polymerase-3 subunit gamma/tau
MADQRYLVTARKYRPARFREVVAQEHVTDTLKNALKLDRLAHAYLFSGPRGVGKTTTARILAKAINCETPREEREDGAEPCRECDSCRSFEDGRSLNVFEMDAASNNKVDDIRELREKVRIPPQGSQKKVYILDEVHMLSTQAFNALLKTLEEPPSHALFIFATTEPHKVLPTILSRCQRFDFRRIPVPEIVDRLREVCETEGVEADEESLMLLARKGDGALRDALSAFDQAISLCGTTLEYGELTQALGVVDQDLFFRLGEQVATQDTAGVLKLVRHVVHSGYDLQEFLAGLAEHLRNLLVARSLGEDALEEVAASTQQRYATQARRFGEADLLRLLSIAGDAEDEIKSSTQPRLKLEMKLLKMAKMQRAADLQQVIRKIDRLEQMVDQGDLPERLPEAASPPPDASPNASPEEPSAEEASAEEAGGEAAADPSAGQEDGQEGRTEPAADKASEDETGGGAPGATEDATGAPPEDEETEADAAHAKAAAAGSPPAEESPPDEPSRDEPSRDEPSRDEADRDEADRDEAGRDEATGRGGGGHGERRGGSGEEPPGVDYGDLFGTPALGEDGGGGEAAGGTDGNGPSGDGGRAPRNEASPAGDTASRPASGPSGLGEQAAGAGGAEATSAPPAQDRSGTGQTSGSQTSGSQATGSQATGSQGDAASAVVAEPDPSGGAAQAGAAQAGAAQAGAAQAASSGAESAESESSESAGDEAGRLKALERQWEDVVRKVKQDRIGVGSLLGEAEPVDLNAARLTIEVPRDLHRDTLSDKEHFLVEHLRGATEGPLESLRFVTRESDEGAPATAVNDAPVNPRDQLEALRDKYDVLRILFEQFNAEPVW